MQVRSQTLKFIEPARVNLINAKALTTEDPSLEEFWDVIIKGKIYDETLKEDVYGISRDEWLNLAKYPPVVGVWDYFNLEIYMFLLLLYLKLMMSSVEKIY